MTPLGGRSKRNVKSLVTRAKSGRHDAFDQLYRLFYPRLCYYLSNKLSNDHHRAEDIAQETFIIAFNKLEQLQNPECFQSWIYQIANNTLANSLRDKQRHSVGDCGTNGDDIETAIDHAPTPESVVEANTHRDMVLSHINQLDTSSRNVLLLTYIANLKSTEIAEALQLSPGTVRNQLVVARRDLKRLLEKYVAETGSTLFGSSVMLLNSEMLRLSALDLQRRLQQPSESQFADIMSRVMRETFQRKAKTRIPWEHIFDPRKFTGAEISTKFMTAVSAVVLIAGCGIGLHQSLNQAEAEPIEAPSEAQQDIQDEREPLITVREISDESDEVEEETVVAATTEPIVNEPVRTEPPPTPTPEPTPVVAAERALPIIYVASSRVSASVGYPLSPDQILAAVGASAIDQDGNAIGVSLVGYYTGLFDHPGSYVVTVVAQDSYGVKAYSVAVFVDVS